MFEHIRTHLNIFEDIWTDYEQVWAPLGGILGPLKSDLGVFWAKIPLYPYNVKFSNSIFSKSPNLPILSFWILNLHIIICQFQKRSTKKHFFSLSPCSCHMWTVLLVANQSNFEAELVLLQIWLAVPVLWMLTPGCRRTDVIFCTRWLWGSGEDISVQGSNSSPAGKYRPLYGGRVNIDLSTNLCQ